MNQSNTDPTTGLNPASWMHDHLALLGNQPLNAFCMTGSHDSGMSVRTSGTAFGLDCNTLTQTNGIQEQLNLGARYFDIRPVISGGKYLTGHYTQLKIDKLVSWQGANGQSIQEIITDVNAFTAVHQELVILNLSHSLNTDLGNAKYAPFTQAEWNRLFAELSHLHHLFVVHNDPTVNLTSYTLNRFIATGPAVVLVVQANVNLGSYAGQGFYRYRNFNVYNNYSDTNDLEKMARLQFERMQENQDQYFLLSWTLTQSDTQAATCFILPGVKSIKDLADTANAALIPSVMPVVTKTNFPNIIYQDNIKDDQAVQLAMQINRLLLS